MILKVGFVESKCQSLRKATFVKNSAVNFEHSCQSCEYIPSCMLKGGRSPKKKKNLHDINCVEWNIFFIALSMNLNKCSVMLPIFSKNSVTKKFEKHWWRVCRPVVLKLCVTTPRCVVSIFQGRRGIFWYCAIKSKFYWVKRTLIVDSFLTFFWHFHKSVFTTLL